MLAIRSPPTGTGGAIGLGAAVTAGATGAEVSLAAFKATAVKGAAGAGAATGSEMIGGGGVDIFTALVSTGTRSRS